MLIRLPAVVGSAVPAALDARGRVPASPQAGIIDTLSGFHYIAIHDQR